MQKIRMELQFSEIAYEFFLNATTLRLWPHCAWQRPPDNNAKRGTTSHSYTLGQKLEGLYEKVRSESKKVSL